MDNEPADGSATPNWNAILQGTTGGPAPQLSDQNPALDPEYDSFLRGMGLNAAQINANKARQTSALDAQLQAQRPQWADTLTQGLKNIAGNAESNGVYGSGKRLDDQNEFQVGQERAQQNYESGVNNQIGDLNANADSQLLGLAQQNAEQQLAARQRLAQSQMANNSNPVIQNFLQAMLGQQAQ